MDLYIEDTLYIF